MGSIQWTDETWNPITGCSKVSAGCKNCYAEKMALRLQKMGQPNYRDGFAVRTHEHMLAKPLNWKRPRRIFVNSMSDLFHEDVPFDFIERVFSVMAAAQQHQFQVLTKRPERMLEFFRDPSLEDGICYLGQHWTIWDGRGQDLSKYPRMPKDLEKRQPWPGWPLPNVWLGTSIEDVRSIHRLSPLSQTPAAVRFISFEPLLEDVVSQELADAMVGHHLHWAIIGGESGPEARLCDPRWVSNLVEFLTGHGTAVFVKQLGAVWAKQAGAKDAKGGNPDEWPEHLRVREFPEVR